MANEIFEKMSMFSSKNVDDNPFDDIPTSKNLDIGYKISKSKKQRRNYDDDDDTLSQLDKLNAKFENTTARLGDDEFEYILNELDDNDEDIELRDEIVAGGRKYARDFTSSGDNSEITKAFAPQVSRLDALYKRVTHTTGSIEEDINKLQLNRSVRPSQLTDLHNAKVTSLNAELAVLKEINNVTKTQIELKNKAKSDKETDPNSGTQALMQSIFGMGRGAILDSVDNGNDEPDIRNVVNDIPDSDDDDDEGYDSSDDAEDDGDKFLKYENSGVSVVLEEYQDSSKVVYAEDRDGNRISDYPIPTDIDDLKFEVNERTNTAYDQLQRKYEYRRKF